MLRSAYRALPVSVVLIGCFLIGLVAGKVNWSAVFDTWYLSYENKYLSMSGSLVEYVVYHVIVDDVKELAHYVNTATSEISLHETPFDNLRDVHVKADDRLQAVKALRALDGVSAVLSVPLMCH